VTVDDDMHTIQLLPASAWEEVCIAPLMAQSESIIPNVFHVI